MATDWCLAENANLSERWSLMQFSEIGSDEEE